MKDPAPSAIKTYNYCRKTNCPVDGNCLTECLIYEGFVNTMTN